MDRLSVYRYSEADRLSACRRTRSYPPAATDSRMEHLDSYLAADGIELPADLLDRIDQIVPPGVTINVADNMWNVGTTALDAAFRRR